MYVLNRSSDDAFLFGVGGSLSLARALEFTSRLLGDCHHYDPSDIPENLVNKPGWANAQTWQLCMQIYTRYVSTICLLWKVVRA